MTATTGVSLATVSGSTFTGFYLENFFANVGEQAIGTNSIVGTATFSAASVAPDGSPALYRGSSTDPGLNIWSYSSAGTTTFTQGQVAFSGTATWSITEALYMAIATAPQSGNLYFPAMDVSGVASSTLLGTWSVILPQGVSILTSDISDTALGQFSTTIVAIGPQPLHWSLVSDSSGELNIDSSTGVLSANFSSEQVVTVTVRAESVNDPGLFDEKTFTFEVTESQVESWEITGLPTGYFPGWGLSLQNNELVFPITTATGVSTASQRGGIGFVPVGGGIYSEIWEQGQTAGDLDPQVVFFDSTGNLNAFNGLFSTPLGTAGLYQIAGTTTTQLTTTATPYSTTAKYGWSGSADNFFIAVNSSTAEVLGANTQVSATTPWTKVTNFSVTSYGVASTPTKLYDFGSATIHTTNLSTVAPPNVPLATSRRDFPVTTGQPCSLGSTRLLTALDDAEQPHRIFYTVWGSTSGSTTSASGRICEVLLDNYGDPAQVRLVAGPTTSTLGSVDGLRINARFEAIRGLVFDADTNRLYAMQRVNSVDPDNLLRAIEVPAIPVSIVTSALAEAFDGVDYEFGVRATGANLVWTLIEDTSGTLTIDPNTGVLSGPVPPGSYTVTVRAEDAFDPANFHERTWTLTGVAPVLLPWVEGFETAGIWTLTGTQWEQGTPTSGPGSAHGGANVIATKLATDYSSDITWGSSTATSPWVLLAGPSPYLSFFTWYNTEATFDGFNLKISTDGVTFTTVTTVTPSYAGTLSSQPAWYGIHEAWEPYVADLSAWSGQAVKLRFDFRSDGSQVRSGVFIDDLQVTPVAPVIIATASLPAGLVGIEYHAQLQAQGAQDSTWSLLADDSGSLSIDPVTGELTGTPGFAGQFEVTVRLESNTDPSNFDEKTLDFEVFTPPANDSCDTPEMLELDGTPLTGTTINAWNHNLPGDQSPTCATGAGADVVYVFSLAEPRHVTVTLTSQTSGFTPFIYVRSGVCDDAQAASEVACGSGGYLGLLPAGDYYVWVDSASATGGNFTISATGLAAGVCGDGVRDFGEQCDDGNLTDFDGCDDAELSPGVPGTCTVSPGYTYDPVGDVYTQTEYTAPLSGVTSMTVDAIPAGFFPGPSLVVEGENLYFSITNAANVASAGTVKNGIGRVSNVSGTYIPWLAPGHSLTPDPQAVFFNGGQMYAFSGLYGTQAGSAPHGLYRLPNPATAVEVATAPTGGKAGWSVSGSNFFVGQGVTTTPYDAWVANVNAPSSTPMVRVTNASSPFVYGMVASTTKLYVFGSSSGTFMVWNLTTPADPGVPSVVGANTNYDWAGVCNWNGQPVTAVLDNDVNPTRLFYTVRTTVAASATNVVNRICVASLDPVTGNPVGSPTVFAGSTTGAAAAGSVDSAARTASTFETITALAYEPATELLYVLQRQNSVDPKKLIRVVSAAPDPLAITTTSLPDALVGAPYSGTVQRINGPVTVEWSVIDNGGGEWLSIDPATGVLSGTPTNSGPASVIVHVEDPLNPANFAEVTFEFEVLTATFVEFFDTPGPVPTGWTATGGWSVEAGSLGDSSGGKASTGTSLGHEQNWELTSPEIAVGAGQSRLVFTHDLALESTYDVGVLEVSVNAGPFVEVTVAGGTFISGGYNSVRGTGTTVTGATPPANAYAGQPVWSASSPGFQTTTVVNLNAFAGQTIALRWRYLSDTSVTTTGAHWYIDDVYITEN